ncbi:MAG: hypothetical protein HYV97_04930 [Bdellovibrio sp.]|nr:hypothetical protein [Bdellovibrio sp.]
MRLFFLASKDIQYFAKLINDCEVIPFRNDEDGISYFSFGGLAIER